jgi:hypothetical protein
MNDILFSFTAIMYFSIEDGTDIDPELRDAGITSGKHHKVQVDCRASELSHWHNFPEEEQEYEFNKVKTIVFLKSGVTYEAIEDVEYFSAIFQQYLKIINFSLN